VLLQDLTPFRLLTYKAEMLGYHPDVILAGRRINDNMGKFLAEQTVKRMIQSGSQIKGAQVNILGITFKENVPDLRNSKVIDLIHELVSFGVKVHVHDPVANVREARHEYGIELASWDVLPEADAIIVAVAHQSFLQYTIDDYRLKVKPTGCFVDVKSCCDIDALRKIGLTIWRL
jgi:UDP-N-acetyl-D-galactosamine dehydrogenase